MEKLLFVCQRNFDRSPTAQHITEVKAAQMGLSLQVSSAGLSYPQYGYMSEYMVDALIRLGYYTTPSTHTPKRVDPDSLLNQDLILCFEDYQAAAVNRMLQGKNQRVYTLPAFAGESIEIVNPQARIKDDLLSTAAMSIPLGSLKRIASNKLGYVHRMDVEGVEGVHDDIAKTIEKYVVKALDRIASESKS